MNAERHIEQTQHMPQSDVFPNDVDRHLRLPGATRRQGRDPESSIAGPVQLLHKDVLVQPSAPSLVDTVSPVVFPQEKKQKKRTRKKEDRISPAPIVTLELGPHGPRPGVEIEAVREMIMDPDLEILFIVGPQGVAKTTLAERIKEGINASDTVDRNGQAIFARHMPYDIYRERRMEVNPDRSAWTLEDSHAVEGDFFAEVMQFLEPSVSHPHRATKMRRKVVLDATTNDDGTISRGLDTLIRLIQERGPQAVRVVALVPNPEILEETIRSRLAAADKRTFSIMVREDTVSVQRPVTRRRGKARDEEKLRQQMLHSGFAETTMSRLGDWYVRIKEELEKRGISWENILNLFQLPEFLQRLKESEVVSYMKRLGGSVDQVIQTFAYYFKKIFPEKTTLPEDRVTVAIVEKAEKITRVAAA